LGQRGGLGIGGRRGAAEEPWYVVGKDVDANVLHVAQGNANRWLSADRLAGSAPAWIDGEAPAQSFRCSAMVRYRQSPQPCRVIADGGQVHVAFDDPQRAIAPGQSVVFFDGDVCLGG